MRSEEGFCKGTSSTFALCACNVYDIQAIDFGSLDICGQRHDTNIIQRSDNAIEWPSLCNHSLMPNKLGVPVNVGSPFRLGIFLKSLLAFSFETTLQGLLLLRLPSRSAIALCCPVSR